MADYKKLSRKLGLKRIGEGLAILVLGLGLTLAEATNLFPLFVAVIAFMLAFSPDTIWDKESSDYLFGVLRKWRGSRTIKQAKIWSFGFGIISLIIFFIGWNRVHYLSLAAIGLGILMVIWGTTSVLFPSERETKNILVGQRRRKNIEKFGVEDPEKSWDCPKCSHTNPNYSYICQQCKMSLV